MFQLRNIEELYLSHNGLFSLPPGIDTMISLKILDLSYNPLGALPSGIGGMRMCHWYFDESLRGQFLYSCESSFTDPSGPPEKR